MKQRKVIDKPALSWIRRGLEMESTQLRLPSEVKKETMEAAEKLDTSMNHFVEAAIKWYLDALKKEGSL
jgi:predicted transcriptional regulator